MTKTLFISVRSTISPYYLQTHPIQFDRLVSEVVVPHQTVAWQQPYVTEIEEPYVCPLGWRMIRAKADGLAEVWKERA